MVVALGPGKFYGSSLPRPRIYTTKGEGGGGDQDDGEGVMMRRVDPPVGVLDPLLSWANDAHWSMGGLSFKRLRLQGRIEGCIKKLRSDQYKLLKKTNGKSVAAVTVTTPINNNTTTNNNNNKGNNITRTHQPSPSSPPPPPAASKRRRLALLLHDDSSDVGLDQIVVPEEKQQPAASGIGSDRRRRPLAGKQKRARKLVDDFDKVATSDSGMQGDTIAYAAAAVSEIRENPYLENEKKMIRKGKNNQGSGSSVASRTRSARRSSEEDGEGWIPADAAEYDDDDDDDDDDDALVKGKSSVAKIQKGSSSLENEKTKKAMEEIIIKSGSISTPPPKIRTSPRLSSGSAR